MEEIRSQPVSVALLFPICTFLYLGILLEGFAQTHEVGNCTNGFYKLALSTFVIYYLLSVIFLS